MYVIFIKTRVSRVFLAAGCRGNTVGDIRNAARFRTIDEAQNVLDSLSKSHRLINGWTYEIRKALDHHLCSINDKWFFYSQSRIKINHFIMDRIKEGMEKVVLKRLNH